jgi:hypothetical protein
LIEKIILMLMLPVRLLRSVLIEPFQSARNAQRIENKNHYFISWQKQDPEPEKEALLRARIRRQAARFCHYGNKLGSTKVKY